MEVDKKIIYIGTTENLCVICGVQVPEGREVCPCCEHKVFRDDK